VADETSPNFSKVPNSPGGAGCRREQQSTILKPLSLDVNVKSPIFRAQFQIRTFSRFSTHFRCLDSRQNVAASVRALAAQLETS
jgi:hypothetical protein